MHCKYSNAEKQKIINRYQSGSSVASLINDTEIPRSTIYAWIKQDVNNKSTSKEVSIKNFRLLENKVARLEGIIEIFQSVDCTAKSPLDVKLCVLEELYGKYNAHMLCDALQVPRGTFYNHIRPHAKNRYKTPLKKELEYYSSNALLGTNSI